jgi:hypothetical protein
VIENRQRLKSASESEAGLKFEQSVRNVSHRIPPNQRYCGGRLEARPISQPRCQRMITEGTPMSEESEQSFGGYVGMTYIQWWKVAVNIIAGFLMCLLTGRLFRSLVVKIRSYVGPA